MKKIVFGTLILLMLSSCGNSKGNDAQSNDKDLEKTISSLKQENKELDDKVKKYQLLLEGFNSNNTSDSSNSSSSESTTNNTMMTHGLNDEVSLTDGSKETVKLKAVKASTNQADFPSHLISLDAYDTNKMVSISFEYTNVAYGEAFLPHAQYFQAFSKDGKSLVQVNQQDGQDRVAEGRTGTTRLFWELPVDGSQFDEIEIDFVPSNEKVASFKLPVTH